MVDLEALSLGDKVHYKPDSFSPKELWENGMVKRVSETFVFVVFDCDDDWAHFEDYTAASVRPEDLYPGWVRFA